MKKNILILILLTGLISTMCTGCNNRNIVKFDLQSGDLFYGVGEPLVTRIANGDVNMDDAIEAMYRLGVKSFRLWMNTSDLLTTPDKADDVMVSYYTKIIDECAKKGIVVLGVSHTFSYNGNMFAAPSRDLTKGSDYMKFMQDFETSWETMAKSFPNVQFWELGNESNSDAYLHPSDYFNSKTEIGHSFSQQEKAEITVDMMYYGSLGVHRGNKNAQTVMPAPGPYDGKLIGMERDIVSSFIDDIYNIIESGNWPSTNPDDYFQNISWHPYNVNTTFNQMEPDEDWVHYNNLIYDIVKKHGDIKKPVFFTEFGYTDYGNPTNDKRQAEWIKQALELTKNNMPYVKMFIVFRLLDDKKAAFWGGIGQVYFGMFDVQNKKLIPKQKAFMFQQVAGGKGNISDIDMPASSE